MRLLVDTNVLVDYVCHRNEFYEAARSVFETALTGKNELLLTDLSYMNCIYVAKHYNINFDLLMETLLAIHEICGLARIDYDVMHATLSSNWKDKEDALQYEAALASRADGIVTRNPKDFKLSTISIILPTELSQQ